MSSFEVSWFALLCSSRSRVGIKMPPFYWGALKHWWGWRYYVVRHFLKPFRRRRGFVGYYPNGQDE